MFIFIFLCLTSIVGVLVYLMTRAQYERELGAMQAAYNQLLREVSKKPVFPVDRPSFSTTFSSSQQAYRNSLHRKTKGTANDLSRSYAVWSQKENTALLEQYCKREVSLQMLAHIHQRSVAAVISQLRRQRVWFDG